MKPEIRYYESGQIWSERWKNDTGKYHRLDGPAVRYWDEDGQIWIEKWCVDGQVHRLDGPAVRHWDEDGQLEEEWHISGVQYKTKNEFLIAVDLYKANEIAELF